MSDHAVVTDTNGSTSVAMDKNGRRVAVAKAKEGVSRMKAEVAASRTGAEEQLQMLTEAYRR